MSSRTTRVMVDLGADNAGVLQPALEGDMVVHGRWKVVTHDAQPASIKRFFLALGRMFNLVEEPANATGPLGPDDVKIVRNRKGINEVQITLPADAPNPLLFPVLVKLKVRYGKYYAGESVGINMLVVHDKSSPEAFNQTVAHEFGHGFKQTPRHGDEPMGMAPHPQQYTNEHGGVGSHCRTGTRTLAHPSFPAGLYEYGTCVMFHRVAPDTWTGEFCSDCQPYLRLTGMDKLG